MTPSIPPAPPPPSVSSVSSTADQWFSLGDLALSLGGCLPDAQLCYVTLGKLNAAGDNAILIAHGYSSSHRFVLADEPDGALGSWSPLIGSGKAIDTDRYFVIATNALGSSYGSTGPANISALTNRPYGPDFPAIQFKDRVNAQYQLLQSLGVKRLHAVIGLSMGGFEAFQWAVQYPDFMRKVVPVLTAPWGALNAKASQNSALDRLQLDPNWNDGWYYPKRAALTATLTDIRMDTLTRYSALDWLKQQHTDTTTAQRALEKMASCWASHFDPNAMIALRQTINRFDAREKLASIKADMLYVLSSSDQLFPPTIAQATLEPLRLSGRAPTYFELVSDYGHLASSLDWQQWAAPLADFLNRD